MDSVPVDPVKGHAPLLFFYTHLHDAIRAELDALSEAVSQLEREYGQTEQIIGQLTRLRARYRFLEQVYKYHSSVEDEVVYPALDSKVKNVTRAYSVEHEDEEHLLEELLSLLDKALSVCSVSDQSASDVLWQLLRKVEEVHTTLRKHLAKEEQQLLPLLLHHFEFGEQAELVAQFLCSIPLAAVRPVLSWIKRTIPIEEQKSLQSQVESAVPDYLLKQLVTSWLAPEEHNNLCGGAKESSAKEAPDLQSTPSHPNIFSQIHDETEVFKCCGECINSKSTDDGDQKVRNLTAEMRGIEECPLDGDINSRSTQGVHRNPARASHPPLREILYFHQAIRSALSSFAEEARALRDCEGNDNTVQLASLVERHRFIRAVCLFHSSSEDEIVFPALRRVSNNSKYISIDTNNATSNLISQHKGDDIDGSNHGDVDEKRALLGENSLMISHRHRCEEDHMNESAQFEELGRLLGDVRASIRRGAKGVEALTQDIAQEADKLARAMSRHMTREETEVLPLLMKSLCLAEQRFMVWRLIRAMPLRLLERVMPWVAGKLRNDDVKEWLYNIKRAAPESESVLVELLSKWTDRKERKNVVKNSSWRTASDDPCEFSIETCNPKSSHTGHIILGGLNDSSSNDVRNGQSKSMAETTTATQDKNFKNRNEQGEEALPLTAPPLKRIKTSFVTASNKGRTNVVPQCAVHTSTCTAHSMPPSPTSTTIQENPIDHIFQFHKALRRELKELEVAAIDLQTASDATTAWTPGDDLSKSIQELQARFQFLRGIYRAHSSSEDEVIFPALESKEMLLNVSHAYALDHKQEEHLFDEVAQVIACIGACTAPHGLQDVQMYSSKLAKMCAAVRAALETHVRAEETELWPLFAEHFTVEEQQRLVGIIIGRTGAEVLHTMISWVKGSLDEDEHTAMMFSIKSASKSTAFEQWLETQEQNTTNNKNATATTAAAAATTMATTSPWEEEQREVLAEVAKYLAKQGLTHVGGHTTTITTTPPSSLNNKNSNAVGTSKMVSNNEIPTVAGTAYFRPGWEDIFKLNQKQLEAAVRRVSADASLEPQRKAYLIQHLMASKYIVAQQKRAAQMATGSSRGTSAGVTPTTATATDGLLSKQQQRQGIFKDDDNKGDETMQGVENAESSHQKYHTTERGERVLGCRHYQRSAMLIAPCCGGEYVCRLCHDEAVPGHSLDRYAVKEMKCLKCETRQPVGPTCASCKASMARYYCNICHLFDDDPDRDIYHCPFCNFCRRGKGLGIDSFHCMACNACMSLELFNKHRCTEHALAGTCPVCSDPLFDSSAPIKELPCGHFMHSMCFAAYTRYSYTCPVCSKSLGDMSVYWKMIDTLLESEMLPVEYASRQQLVTCNDCGRETQAPFHFVYHKCQLCGGYNTRLQ